MKRRPEFEEISGIKGIFEGKIRRHPSPLHSRVALADGTMTYKRPGYGTVTTKVEGVKIKRSFGGGRYIRIIRGPKGSSDTILGKID